MTSQSNEDEIIAKIFRRIGLGKKRFIEFGCGDGRQNNTIALLMDGWQGVWIDPHRRRIKSAKERWHNYPVRIHRRIITPRNINKFVNRPYDFISMDTDGSDYDIWYAMTMNPRVVCIECGHPVPGSMLREMKELGEAKGYLFYGCSKHNVNAFFVRGDLKNGKSIDKV